MTNHAAEEHQAACCREHSSFTHGNSTTAATDTGEFLKAKRGRESTRVAAHDHKHQATANVQPYNREPLAREPPWACLVLMMLSGGLPTGHRT